MSISPNTQPMTRALSVLGYTSNESAIFVSLIIDGPGVASEIAKRLTIKRGITYAALEKLQKSMLIEQRKFEGILQFFAVNPEEVYKKLATHVDSLTSLQKDIVGHLGEYVNQYQTQISKPVVQYFEGAPGLVRVFKDIYGPGKEVVYGCANIDTVNSFRSGDFTLQKFITKRNKNKLFSEALLHDSRTAREIQSKDHEEMRNTYLTDLALPAEIDVYENKVALLSFKKDKFVGMLIEHPDFAESIRSLLKLAMRAVSKMK